MHVCSPARAKATRLQHRFYSIGLFFRLLTHIPFALLHLCTFALLHVSTALAKATSRIKSHRLLIQTQPSPARAKATRLTFHFYFIGLFSCLPTSCPHPIRTFALLHLRPFAPSHVLPSPSVSNSVQLYSILFVTLVTLITRNRTT